MKKHFSKNLKKYISFFIILLVCVNTQTIEGATDVINPLKDNSDKIKNTFVDDSSLFKANQRNISDSGIFTTVPGCNNIGNKIQKSIGGILSNDPSSFVSLAESIGDIVGGDVTTQDKSANNALKSILTNSKEDKFRTSCMDGIGYQLAKKQLASISEKIIKSAVIGGPDGKSSFQDEGSLLDSIQNKEISRVAKTLGSSNTQAYPFGKDTARGLINSTKARNNFETSLQADFSKYGGIKGASENFTWDTWLDISMHPQKNFLGHTALVSQYLTDSIQKKTELQRDELNQNNGFLSQKKCIEYYPPTNTGGVNPSSGTYNTGKGECKKYETVTPGSILAEQLFAVATSPIRQLELADGVNETLSGVFNKLVNKLGLQGLLGVSSFSTGRGSYTVGGGTSGSSFGSSTSYSFGSNFGGSIDNGDAIISVNKGNGWNEGDEPFDLTKDLGNTYLREKPKYLGTWNANTNLTNPTAESGLTATSLSPGIGVKNTYYLVSVTGNTELQNPEGCFPVMYADGSSSHCWNRGDVAVFDGEGWIRAHYLNGRNDGSGFRVVASENGELANNLISQLKTPKLQIIDKKGVIQTQYDYLKAVKASLKELPKIMPALGELDYCIPGPNPSWYDSAELSAEALAGFISGIQFDPNILDITLPDPKQYGSQFYGPTPWKQLNPGKLDSFLRFSFSNIQKSFGDIFGQYFSKHAFDGSDVGSIMLQAIQDTNDLLDQQKEAFIESLDVRLQAFKEASNAIYGQGGSMTTEFLINGNTESVTENPEYLPMAQTGMSLTRNIRVYDLNIQEATKDYKDLIDQSVSNIYRLNLIKKQVDEIIKAAQARRSKEIPKNTIPADCLMYENITYINGGVTTGNLGDINGNIDTSGGVFGNGTLGGGTIGGGVLYGDTSGQATGVNNGTVTQ